MKQQEALSRYVKKYETKASLSPNKVTRPPTTTTDSNSSTYTTGFPKARANSKQSQLPEISRQVKRQCKGDSQEFQDLLLIEKDERYRYLVKNGTIKRIELQGNIIFSELPQIPGVWVCYRRPMERQNNLEKLCLDYLDLGHMPLLEGEEKLKILTYQHNRITLIQNLVSLPNLLYLDLYDNQIKEIEELKQIPKLKVLLLPKNQIRRIQNLDHFTKLEVLDLHSNRIVNMEGLNKLKSLKILNLGNNLIQQIEGVDELSNLVELNLKINQIDNIEQLRQIPQIQKLYLTSNKIQYFPPSLSLIELSLDNNPIAANKNDYIKSCLQIYENLKILDGKSVEIFKQEITMIEVPRTEPITKKKSTQMTSTPQQTFHLKKKPQQMAALEIHGYGSNARDQQKDDSSQFSQMKKEQQQQKDVPLIQTKENVKAAPKEEDVIMLIKRQWIQEQQRINQLEKNNQLTKKTCLEHLKVEGGHAEVEEDEYLLIYGTAASMVLPQQEFIRKIEKIHFQYILFDSLIDTQLNNLRNYQRLREIVLKDNYINSLLQLAKLESLVELKSLVVQNNPINNCSFLIQFLIYRFPMLISINGKDIKKDDSSKAKYLFQNFDKSLQIPEKLQNYENLRQFKSFSKEKQYIKTFHKALQAVADDQQIVFKGKKNNFYFLWDEYLIQLIGSIKQQDIN